MATVKLKPIRTTRLLEELAAQRAAKSTENIKQSQAAIVRRQIIAESKKILKKIKGRQNQEKK
jgi:hypothetical protein